MSNFATQKKYHVLKRILDVIFSFVLIIFLALPMLIIWLAVRIDTRGSGIFRQTRIGMGGKPFVCYKFRTMYLSASPKRPSAGFSDVDRFVTPVGRILRSTSLDELPQLFNVLKGDMSLVGPRPLIPEEDYVHKGRTENGVYSLRPGITGLSQISGRDELPDSLKIELDTKYLYEFGLAEDVRILAQTVKKVISGEGNRSKSKK